LAWDTDGHTAYTMNCSLSHCPRSLQQGATSKSLLPKRHYCENLMRSTVASAWWCEPLIASAAFFFFMFFFRRFESHPYGGSGHPLTLAAVASLFVYWLGVGLWVAIVPTPVGASSGCVHDMASLAMLAAEVLCGIISYDFVLFWLHVLMHSWPAVGKAVGHGKHHSFGDEANWGGAFRTTNHSLVDGTLQVLVNILVQRHTPWGAAKSKLARWLHNVLVIEMLVESHSDSKYPRLARRWFAGVDGHAEHHRHHGPPYEQFFGYLDRLHACVLARRSRSLRKKVE